MPPFATLTPANLAAILSFDEIYDGVRLSLQKDFIRLTQKEPQYRKDVHDFRLSQARRCRRTAFGYDVSDSSTEPDERLLADTMDYGMVWEGHFVFDFKVEPNQPRLGWVLGTHSYRNLTVDFVVSRRRNS